MKKSITPQELAQKLSTDKAPLVLDIRRNEDAQADERAVPTAQRFDPSAVAQWANELPRDKEVVVYCQHGRSVSSAIQTALDEHGVSATVLEGGLCGWVASEQASDH